MTLPQSERAKQDERLLRLIEYHWLASSSVDGHRKIAKDLRERCNRHRVHRLMRRQGLRAQVGDGRKPRFDGGTQCKSAANLLDRQFEVTAWASDFTFIRTHEGWMYLAVVIDLFSSQVEGHECLRNPGRISSTVTGFQGPQWYFSSSVEA
ncbi:putative isxac3 transposase orfb (fragment) protein [Xanthomonas albilineans GPE PC73]|uniref:Putative isxac3 transposase orfb protein n=1 Tax=Xanthomonas albilineans (strain GPE PC73 / CFBP 7063) TaxID=380358 RepID=D2UEA2_XANAP